MKEEKIKQLLIENDSHFRQLFIAHQQLEEELQKLENDFLNLSQEEEISRLKFRKLHLKDEMQKMIFNYKKRIRQNMGGQH